MGQADRFCFVLISADAGPNAGDYANTLAGHQSEVRLIRPVAPPEIDSLVWLRAERWFRMVWRGFPRARATLEPAANLMPPGCAPRPFVSFPSLTTWCGQAGLHSCDAARERATAKTLYSKYFEYSVSLAVHREWILLERDEDGLDNIH